MMLEPQLYLESPDNFVKMNANLDHIQIYYLDLIAQQLAVKIKLFKIAQEAKKGFEQQDILAQTNGLDSRKLLGQVKNFCRP